MLPTDDQYYNIPISINYICSLFYYIKEKWNKDIIGSDYEIIEDIIKRADAVHGEQSVLLSHIAISGLYHWKFKFTKYGQYSNHYIDFGIVKRNADLQQIVKTYLGGVKKTAYVWSVSSRELF